MSIEIMEGNLEQLEQIVELNHKIFQGMYKPYPLEHYQEKLSDKCPLIFLVKDSEKLIGDSISFKRDNSFYIWILGVEKEYRGKGIGTRLLEENERFARKNGFELVSTKVYNVSPEMQRLVIKRDYHIVGVDISQSDSIYNAIHFRLKL